MAGWMLSRNKYLWFYSIHKGWMFQEIFLIALSKTALPRNGAIVQFCTTWRPAVPTLTTLQLRIPHSATYAFLTPPSSLLYSSVHSSGTCTCSSLVSFSHSTGMKPISLFVAAFDLVCSISGLPSSFKIIHVFCIPSILSSLVASYLSE